MFIIACDLGKKRMPFIKVLNLRPRGGKEASDTAQKGRSQAKNLYVVTRSGRLRKDIVSTAISLMLW